ncbi:MAG: Rne/Rng family ribonuclease [Rickettsiales bacterium]|nr:Rne/Rng family ribonuclease [Rickettsiales bacterium]
MNKKILVDAVYPKNTRVAVVKDKMLEEFEYSTSEQNYIKGNIYLAKVMRVEPSLQAAFVDYGEDKHGFIPFSEIHSDYYNVPIKDREPIESDVSSKAVEKTETPELADAVLDNISTSELSELEDVADENYIEKIKKQNVIKYKIQEVIKKNQILLVQATKEERGNKGASFTTYISLAGRYCVIMPNSGSQGGISKKIQTQDERKRLLEIVNNLEVKNVGLIVRTNGEQRSKDEITQDFNYLIKLWNKIREKTLSSIAPSFIHAEDDLLKRIIREMYDNNCSEILVQGEQAYKDLLDTVKLMSSTKDTVVTHYLSKTPVFNKYNLNEQINNLYSPISTMKSGAYIVINHTEALISIDVNSGKATSEKNIEETAFKTNIDAAKEIARQIKLRNLSGLIVIDFIDMIESRNKRTVEKILKEEFSNDKAKTQIGNISPFGLLEMSRQRLKPSFLEANTIICNACRGKGVSKSPEVNAITVFKTLDTEIANTKHIKAANVYTAPDNALYILNNKRRDIMELEKKHGISIYILDDKGMSSDSFAIETVHNEVEQQSPKAKKGEQKNLHKKPQDTSIIKNLWEKIVK